MKTKTVISIFPLVGFLFLNCCLLSIEPSAEMENHAHLTPKSNQMLDFQKIEYVDQDTYITNLDPTKNFGNADHLFVSNQTSEQAIIFLYFQFTDNLSI